MLHNLRLRVFELVCLVEDDVVPLVLFELWDNVKSVKCGHTDIKVFPALHLGLEDLLAVFLLRLQVDHPEVGCPPGQLLHPVGNGGLGRDDQVRLVLDTMGLPDMAQDRYSHDGLSKTHIVSEDAIHFILVQRGHPFECVKLVSL